MVFDSPILSVNLIGSEASKNSTEVEVTLVRVSEWLEVPELKESFDCLGNDVYDVDVLDKDTVCDGAGAPPPPPPPPPELVGAAAEVVKLNSLEFLLF